MSGKNSEARECANTNRASIENIHSGNIDMDIVAKSDLNFHGIQLQPVANLNDIWLTSGDIAKALGYASQKSVSTIYSRNSDEFTDAMSMVIKMKTNGINNNLREKSVRVFSLRGCHLIAMFASTNVAKEFRRWVLDILDREIATNQHDYRLTFTRTELCQLSWVWNAAVNMREKMETIYPALNAIKSEHATSFGAMSHEYKNTLETGRNVLERMTANIQAHPFSLEDSNWRVVLPRLRNQYC